MQGFSGKASRAPNQEAATTTEKQKMGTDRAARPREVELSRVG